MFVRLTDRTITVEAATDVSKSATGREMVIPTRVGVAVGAGVGVAVAVGDGVGGTVGVGLDAGARETVGVAVGVGPPSVMVISPLDCVGERVFRLKSMN